MSRLQEKIPMEGIVPNLSARAKALLHEHLQSCQDAPLKTRYLIIVNLVEGYSPAEICRLCHVSRSTVYRIAQRFRDAGGSGPGGPPGRERPPQGG